MKLNGSQKLSVLCYIACHTFKAKSILSKFLVLNNNLLSFTEYVQIKNQTLNRKHELTFITLFFINLSSFFFSLPLVFFLAYSTLNKPSVVNFLILIFSWYLTLTYWIVMKSCQIKISCQITTKIVRLKFPRLCFELPKPALTVQNRFSSMVATFSRLKKFALLFKN